MKNFLRIAERVDVIPLALKLQRKPWLWKQDTYLRDYPQGPFGEIESILLRFPTKSVVETEEELAKHFSTYDQHECVDQAPYAVLTEARPIVMALMHRVGGERLGRIIINKIAPGGRIYPHEDTPAHAEYYDRFHVVIQSAPGVQFNAGDESVYMATGEVWWFDNSAMHEVINNSDTDRIHMVVDIRTSRP